MKRSFLLPIALVAALPSSTHLHERQAGQVCYDGVYIICARGTFEGAGFGLQGTLVSSIEAAIPGSNASAVDYPASVVDYGSSVDQGAANTQQQIEDYYSACPNSKIVLLGYSQGAQVIGNAIAGGDSGIPVLGGSTGPATAISECIGANVIAVNLLGDPNRVLGQGTDFDPHSCNTSSTEPRTGDAYVNMEFYADRLSEWCEIGDPVCCTDGSNPVAHLGYLLSSDNIAAMTKFVADKYYASITST